MTGIEEAAEDVRVLRLADAGGADLPAWEPGAHLELLLPGEIRRQYSLCGSLSDPAEWSIGVLRANPSRGGSAYLHDHVAAGDELDVTGFHNLFPLLPAERYVFIAGGIGITPILPMIAAAEAAGSAWELHYGGRHRLSMPFRDRLAEHDDRVTIYPQDECGLIDLDRALAGVGPGVLVYACGPEPLLDVLGERSARTSMQLHIERFAPASAADDASSTPFEVELVRTGVSMQVPADRSIIDVLEDIGVDVLTSCREGICGTCETEVLGGLADHRDSLLSDEERETGNTMMLCVSRARSPRLVLDL